MKIGILAKIIGGLQLLVAVFYLDLKSWNQILVSTLLFLGGLLMLIIEEQSRFFRTIRAVLAYSILPIAVGFIIKLLWVG